MQTTGNCVNENERRAEHQTLGIAETRHYREDPAYRRQVACHEYDETDDRQQAGQRLRLPPIPPVEEFWQRHQIHRVEWTREKPSHDKKAERQADRNGGTGPKARRKSE